MRQCIYIYIIQVIIYGARRASLRSSSATLCGGAGRGTLFNTEFLKKKLLALLDSLNKFDKHADFEVNF